MLDVQELLEEAQRRGRALGRSIEAMENHPTLAQRRTVRIGMEEDFPGVLIYGPSWWTVFESAFEGGYYKGKAEPEGARRRVALKRAAARAASS